MDLITIYRWVQPCAPQIERRLRWHCRPGGSRGDTMDVHLSQTRNAKAARRFPGKAMRRCKAWERPVMANTGKAGCYAIRELKQAGKCPSETEHGQVKCLDIIVEAGHGILKRLIKPTLGFKSMKTTCGTI